MGSFRPRFSLDPAAYGAALTGIETLVQLVGVSHPNPSKDVCIAPNVRGSTGYGIELEAGAGPSGIHRMALQSRFGARRGLRRRNGSRMLFIVRLDMTVQGTVTEPAACQPEFPVLLLREAR